ncbi:MAG: SMP-30/gluconolactonase/LRE family protein [Gammaproteobacteria bacterium]|nr:SMP-30/gluconolactonase/LRE family protein [Gammaproteobacteria bacterium]MBU1443857.1 SMP-30/gluconolactonase/LRE family protein [Gammaproteobacteria bacterium]MBU2287328.1 SMP-30/gluconolactonase/LRE family protein [Gammaproteobacteria bacterium]MBU2409215.1 SMP-30/gluconolactonase/LRE family protein [Gammaproteobacteria bacterium]
MDALFLHDTAPGSFDAAKSVRFRGEGFHRPECVLANVRGDLFSADWRGGVAHLLPDGTQHLYLGTLPDGGALRPNGIALLADGSFLLAHLGAETGGVYRLTRYGEVTPWLLEIDGTPLPPTNFVTQDHAGRTWITVSTRKTPRSLGYRRSCNDGFIVCVLPSGEARIAADGLGYTNEVAIHPGGDWLYVNETFARRLSRFALLADGSLGAKEVVAEFGAGTFPDGLAFDEEGHAWVVSIVSNRLIRVAPDGRQTVWIEDADPAHLAWVEAAYLADRMDRAHLDRDGQRLLRNISSIAFAGPERRIAVFGCLLGDRLACVHMPVAGVPPIHWNYA